MTPREPDHRPQRRAVDPKTGRLYRIVHALKAPPRAVRKAQLDNVALVPASLLPYKATYQQIANAQPPGTTLVVLPLGSHGQRRTMRLIAARLKATGHRVQMLTSEAIQQHGQPRGASTWS